ncbi:MAG: hypothetical protein A3B68_06445 [Candidatus Melainabacteria bacterium RIFCSPHIGHO2_02_FULL_34_12]|nr:MAG: hypothetical protein A3B68_06445 [Candidatus Melainabacteria bacterium RIFCSPHIGHO2_02_FULL_34_12]
MFLNFKQRFYIWLFFFFSFIFLIWLELFNLQVVSSKKIVSKAKLQFSMPKIILRGDIRDRNGSLLALDLVTYDIYNNVDKSKAIPEDKVIKLSKILRISQQNLIKKLNQRKNTKIFPEVSLDIMKKIKDSQIDFVHFEPRVSRIYPLNKMASHLLGYVNTDHIGQNGVEYSHEDLLTKISTKTTNKLYPQGNDIVLTIDSALQEYAEKELIEAIQKSRAERGSILVISPKTGEIFAWAVYPNYNPNFYYKEKSIKNWAITDIYQPGSTFKIVTISSALENMLIDENFTYFDTGSITVGKRILRNHNKTKPQNINLLELFKQSSNVASAHIGLSMPPEVFYNSIQKFMIGTRTKVDLPGESLGLLLNHKKWRTIDSATTGFGQGAVSVTPIQLACAVNAVANHGIWVQPHILKGTWDPEYNLINESPYQPIIEEVISPEVADYVSGLLKQSVKESVEAMAYIGGNVPGYEVAGKTGTAQKIRADGKGYLAGHTVASFIGYLPASDPKILTLVVVDDPKTGGGWGNTVCGPIFNNVAKMAAKRILEN